MAAIGQLPRSLLNVLPPRVLWGLWRVALLAREPARRRVPAPPVAVAHIAWGAGEEELAELAKVLCEGGDSPPSRVLLVTDCDAVHVAAAHGCRLEHIPSREDWLLHVPGGDHDAFVAGRVASILASYRVERLERSGTLPGAVEPIFEAGGKTRA